jgi:hypothetical protein
MIAPANRRQIDRLAMRRVLEVRRRRLAEELRLRVARIRELGADHSGRFHASHPRSTSGVS